MIGFPTDWMKAAILLVFIGSVAAQEKGHLPASETAGKSPHVGEPTKAKSQESGGEGALPNPSNASSGNDKTPDQPRAPRVSTGKRDPFRPFTMTPRGNLRRRENLAPLERYELGQLKLVAVIWDLKEPNALVEDSVGLGYIVKAGTPIGTNDGRVKVIKPGEIIIEETYVDVYGAKKKRDVSMLLNVESAQ